MSRYSDDYDGEDFPGQANLWQANARRAMQGKRGRKALADLRDALLALPEKRLISSAMCTVNPEKRVAEKQYTRPDGTVVNWYEASVREVVESDGEGVCAVGAMIWHANVKKGMTPEDAFDALPTLTYEDGGLEETASVAAREAGLVWSVAWELAYRNDETFQSLTPEQRYEHYVAWLNEQLAVAS